MIGYIALTLFTIAYVECGVVRRQDFCPLFCPAIYQPLCGSDGKTYENECVFHLAHCKDDTLTVVAKAPCGVVDQVKRDALAQIGDMRSRGIHVQARGIICTTPWCWPTHAPVCGSDGNTYENECELNNAMCDNESLKVQHVGTCTPTY